MDTTASPPALTSPSSRTSSRFRRLLRGAIAASTVTAALGLTWLLLPQLSLAGGPPTDTLLGSLLGLEPAVTSLTVACLLGIGAGIAALAGNLPRTALVAVATLQVVVGGLGMGSMSMLSVAGYLLAMAVPFLAVLLVVQVIRRYPRARVVVVPAAVIAVAVGVPLLGEAVRELVVLLVPALVAELPRIGVILLTVALGALWAGSGVLAVRDTVAMTRATTWVTRHRVLFTVLAAVSTLPYALVRLSWLTPWPQFAPGQGLDLSTRLWGLTLSSGCWVALVLTLGLIRPWGEVFPRWMPVVAGRPVPIAAAAVPGGMVAALLCFTAVPLLSNGAGVDLATRLTFALIFPCWLWGPTLALAVWGYVGHRRDQQLRRSAPEAAGAGTS